MKANLKTRGAVALLLLAGFVTLGWATYGLTQGQPQGQAAVGKATAEDVAASFRHVAQKTLPAVVSIVSRTRGAELTRGDVQDDQGQGQGGQGNPLDDELFRRFFGEQFGQQFGGPGGGRRFQIQPRRMPSREGQGSGFVIDTSGIVLTNSHVVNGADQVTIEFQDGSEIRAESWHADPWSDVAIVRFKPTGKLTSLAMGDSSLMEVGDWVLALGDPFGVGTSVTAGIISGKGRAPHINEREDFLQTDAAINPGNSGGPLVNLNGEVIGINTAISTRSGGYDGVGFAVPINLARWVADQLIKEGKVARPYLGVMVQPLTADLRANLGIGFGEGALVGQTTPDGPAQAAGLKSGDIILDVNGQKVAGGTALQGIVERLDIGKSYPVHILRDGKRETVNVTVQEMPKKFAAARSAEAAAPQEDKAPAKTQSSEKLGLTVSDLTADLRKGLRIDDKVEGVVVTEVDEDGPAAEKGISQGDVIERVGTTTVSSAKDFEAAVSKASGGNGVLLFVRSGGSTRILVVHPREK